MNKDEHDKKVRKKTYFIMYGSKVYYTKKESNIIDLNKTQYEVLQNETNKN